MFKSFAYLSKRQQSFCSFNFLTLNPFFIQLCYFLTLSLFGYLGLKLSNSRTPISNDLDLFYTSVSASTVSSMVAIEMETFSNSQLILLIFLMFVGGEVFTSFLDLLLASNHFYHSHSVSVTSSTKDPPLNANQIEFGLVSVLPSSGLSKNHKQSDINNINAPCRGSISACENEATFNNYSTTTSYEVNFNEGLVSTSDYGHLREIQKNNTNIPFNNRDKLKYNSLRCLTHAVLGYLVVINVVGFSLVSLYITLIPSAIQVLKNKGIKVLTFSLFTVVSTFASCGFVPTNENMMVFKKNSGLLLLILPHIFLGNTLYPPCLRLLITLLKKVSRKEEFSYLLKNSKDIGYDHLLSALHCRLLVATVLGFNVVQFAMFCLMEWNSKNMEGLNLYQKLIASMFQVTNARHAGESVFDLSTISSAILVLFIVMMYLPPYTTFLPTIRDHKDDAKGEERSLVEYVIFSQLSYLVIFIFLICITENKSLKEDPLNFNVLNITLEVISAYGNVGFSTGYSCARKLKEDGMCKDSWVGFSGRWSSKGKFILILVMFFGRLKKFNMKGGKAWHLS